MTIHYCPRHGRTAVVYLCPHVARGDAETVYSWQVEGKENWRWCCEACWNRDDFSMKSSLWRAFCMVEARERLREYVRAE